MKYEQGDCGSFIYHLILFVSFLFGWLLYDLVAKPLCCKTPWLPAFPLIYKHNISSQRKFFFYY